MDSGGRVLKAEGTISAKVLKVEPPGVFEGPAQRRSMWLQLSEGGGSKGNEVWEVRSGRGGGGRCCGALQGSEDNPG